MKSKIAKRLVAAAFIATCVVQHQAMAVNVNGGILYNTITQTVSGQAFNNGKAMYGGGAIYNEYGNQTLTISGDSSFKGNTLTSTAPNSTFGGAVGNMQGASMVFDGKADFTNNSSPAYVGGAIYNEGNLTFNDDASFNGNSANWQGGAIYNEKSPTAGANDGKITFNGNASFTGNKATTGAGGAIFNTGTIDFNGETEFKNNTAAGDGGALHNSGGTVNFNGKSLFDGNTAAGKGAIGNTANGNMTFTDTAVFNNNTATSIGGGAILNQDSTLTMKDASFTNNKAAFRGGALYQETSNQNLPGPNGNVNAASTVIEGTSQFINNSAAGSGAIYNYAAFGGTSEITFKDNAVFEGNKATAGNAGAIGNYGGTITFEKGAVFKNNSATGKGGAIYNGGTLIFKNSTEDIIFDGNTANGEANDIYMANDSILKIEGVRNVIMNGGITGDASSNAVIENGGYFLTLGGDSSGFTGTYNQTGGITNSNGTFFGGESNISNANTILNLNEGSKLASTSTINMSNGAIINIADGLITETGSEINMDHSNLNFNNTQHLDLHTKITGDADSKIFKDKEGNVYLYSDNSDFKGITEIKGSGRFEVKENGQMFGGQMIISEGAVVEVISDVVPLQDLNNSSLIVRPHTGHGITFNDTVTSTNNSVITAIAGSTGDIDFTGAVEQNAGSTLNAIAQGGDVNFSEDVEITLSNLHTNANSTNFDKSLKLDNANFVVTRGGFHVADDMTIGSSVDVLNGAINQNTIGGDLLIGTSGEAKFAVDISPRDNRSDTIDIAGNIDLSPDAIAAGLAQGFISVDDFGFSKAPIDRHVVFKPFNVDGTISNQVEFTATDKQVFTPIGYYGVSSLGDGTYSANLMSYNPQVFRAQVATVSQYMNQLVSNNILLDHASIVSGQFLASDTANQYAAINPLFAPYQYSRKDGGLWFKSYGNFETLAMTQGLNVKNNSYGSIIGADLPLVNLKNGWKLIPTAYLSYNGGHQTFNGVSMYQNGAQAGVMGTAYKGDFFTSLLAYGGGYANDMNVAGYTDHTGNWFAGVASKTAYNIHLPKDFILQPNALVSYNIFGSQNFGTNFGEMSMNSGFLNGINVAPGLNLIWNKKTFSLYATTQLVYNIMGDVTGRAGNVTLPNIEMRHAYFEYGLGAMKKFKDRFVGYVQISLRNGGRTGVGFQGGIQWRI